MNETELAQLHDSLVNGKAQRGKLGGLGLGDRNGMIIDRLNKSANHTDLRLPDRPLYKRFVLASRKELCRHTVVSTLKANGGEIRWYDLVLLIAAECGEEVTRDFKYRVLTNIPQTYLSEHSPLVSIPK